MCAHKSSIRRKDEDYPVAVHYNDLKHDISTFRFCGMEKVKISDRRGYINNTLSIRECFGIFTFQTLFPRGFNDEMLMYVML
jgi:hypothetical protein